MKPRWNLQEDVDLALLPEDIEVVEVAPKKAPQTPAEWIRDNLFSSWFNGALTVVVGAIVALGGYRLLRWLFVTSDWAVIKANLRVYMVGRFPVDELWRVWAGGYYVILLAGISWGVYGIRLPRGPVGLLRRAVLGAALLAALVWLLEGVRIWLLIGAAVALFSAGVAIGRVGGKRVRLPLGVGWALAFPVVIVLLRGFDGVPPFRWNGFLINVLLAVVGILLSFPFGILLALGRRGTLPIVRTFCVGFIEFIRGVPLVTLLIFGQFVLPLLLPRGVRMVDIMRAMVMITVFSAAYIAEIVRGGLQGVDHGQYDAARALGLPTMRMMGLVILPQALRNTIPATIGQYISLFKDTSLIAIIGIIDMLSVARGASRVEFSGSIREALLGAAIVFWVVAFSMSRWSQRLEKRLGVGER